MKNRSKIEFRVKSVGPSAENLFQALEPLKNPAPNAASRSARDRRLSPDFDIGGVDLVCGLWN